jgi:hypothetical protein
MKPITDATKTDLIYPSNVIFLTKTSLTRMAEKHITFVAYYGRIDDEYVLVTGIHTFGNTYYGAIEFRVVNNDIELDHITPMGKELGYFMRKYQIVIPEDFSDYYEDYDDDFKALYRKSRDA